MHVMSVGQRKKSDYPLPSAHRSDVQTTEQREIRVQLGNIRG